jgi:hypothetical protein
VSAQASAVAATFVGPPMGAAVVVNFAAPAGVNAVEDNVFLSERSARSAGMSAVR